MHLGAETNNKVSDSFLPALLSAWLCFLVLDFFIHTILLASWWHSTESYWLPRPILFRRIPFGYLSFVIYCGMLVWLQIRILGPGPKIPPSLRVASVVGIAFGCSFALGAYSVLRLPVSALFVWPLSFLFESLGAAVASSVVIRAIHPWRKLMVIVALFLVLFVLVIVLQNVLR
jgi:hypothetical protein